MYKTNWLYVQIKEKHIYIYMKFIMNVINFGNRIPFHTLPTPIILKNNMSSLKHANIVEKSI